MDNIEEYQAALRNKAKHSELLGEITNKLEALEGVSGLCCSLS